MGFRVQAKQITKSQNFRHGVLYTIFSFINNGINFIEDAINNGAKTIYC